jgi:hypothetical protein
MKLAIMQPYLFPYLGYFQLVNAVDTFIFYDDVNYIKRGWINRNQILDNGKAVIFSVPLRKVSQNRLISETELTRDRKWVLQFYKTLEQNYKNAPYYDETIQLVKRVFDKDHSMISSLSIDSVVEVSNYLELNKQFEVSSKDYSKSIGLSKVERLIAICKENGSSHYLNLSGGKALYDKITFKSEGITLSFIENELLSYAQYGNEFVKGLSMIDVLMFNSIQETKNLLSNYKLT